MSIGGQVSLASPWRRPCYTLTDFVTFRLAIKHGQIFKWKNISRKTMNPQNAIGTVSRLKCHKPNKMNYEFNSSSCLNCYSSVVASF